MTASQRHEVMRSIADDLKAQGRPGAACLVCAVQGCLVASGLTSDDELGNLGRALAQAGLRKIEDLKNGGGE